MPVADEFEFAVGETLTKQAQGREREKKIANRTAANDEKTLAIHGERSVRLLGALESRAEDARALPALGAVPRKRSACVFGFRLAVGSATGKEGKEQQEKKEETTLRQLDR